MNIPDPSTKPAVWLNSIGACDSAVRWARRFKTLREAWEVCPDPQWLLWALDRIVYRDNRAYRRIACRCVREVWSLLTDERIRRAVEVAEQFAEGQATVEDLRVARVAAWEIYDVVDMAATLAANSAAAWAADSAADMAAKEAIAWATSATTAVADEAVAWTIAWVGSRARQCRIIREEIHPWES